MNILMIGDIVGKTGRRFLQDKLTGLRQSLAADLVIANAENASGGLGIDANSAREILTAGVDLISLGNHVWDRKSWLKEADEYPMICRPLNGPPAWPGYDHTVFKHPSGTVILLSLSGQAFMAPALNDPFAAIDDCLPRLKQRYGTKIVIVDFHAEATAEKVMMGYYLQDQVTAVIGTHTHVQTADERILGMGTAYITDVGMTGPLNGVLGMSRERAFNRFVQKTHAPYALEEDPTAILEGLLIKIDVASGQARSLKRIRLTENSGGLV